MLEAAAREAEDDYDLEDEDDLDGKKVSEDLDSRRRLLAEVAKQA